MNQQPTATSEPTKPVDTRMYDLKQEIARKEKNISQLQGEVAIAWVAKKETDATVKTITDDFTRRVKEEEDDTWCTINTKITMEKSTKNSTTPNTTINPYVCAQFNIQLQ